MSLKLLYAFSSSSSLQLHRLFDKEDGKELKIIISNADFEVAVTSSKEKQAKHILPMFEALAIEVAKETDMELIVYCDHLVPSREEFAMLQGDPVEEDSERLKQLIQKKNLSVIRLVNILEIFATSDFLEDGIAPEQ